jgi:hypothetical protein
MDFAFSDIRKLKMKNNEKIRKQALGLSSMSKTIGG